ncbi:hypothetical protein B0T25DRAFT_533504 [Lasiosphaeria hispida]|uniref:Uncharacterized protein n=1 Tax=Lasiosphaeria hispida TaxID=260671 RepID=A0AAJ0HQL3_9PEZI|nr:hypothetical protein B0T25DRAFT_533504 [Lasiosphaeria hispida]
MSFLAYVSRCVIPVPNQRFLANPLTTFQVLLADLLNEYLLAGGVGFNETERSGWVVYVAIGLSCVSGIKPGSAVSSAASMFVDFGSVVATFGIAEEGFGWLTGSLSPLVAAFLISSCLSSFLEMRKTRSCPLLWIWKFFSSGPLESSYCFFSHFASFRVSGFRGNFVSCQPMGTSMDR